MNVTNQKNKAILCGIPIKLPNSKRLNFKTKKKTTQKQLFIPIDLK